MNSLDRLLDATVLPASRWAKANDANVHAASWGLAIVALPVIAAIASSGWEAPLALAFSLLAYLRGYMPLKRRIVPGARRKLLIDLSLFVAPTFVGVSALLGRSVGESADTLAFVVPAGVVILRSGCFVAGCCRSTPSSWGARYAGVEGRFIPLQLFEAIVGLLMLVAASGMTMAAAESGTLLAPLAAIYAGYRFGSEFLRARLGQFAVRRFAGLTLTQWLCAVIVATVAMLGGA